MGVSYTGMIVSKIDVLQSTSIGSVIPTLNDVAGCVQLLGNAIRWTSTGQITCTSSHKNPELSR